MPDATADDHRSPRLQLAIETTGKCGSIAILRDDVIIRAINLPETTRTAASLAVHLDDILKQHRDGSQPTMSWSPLPTDLARSRDFASA